MKKIKLTDCKSLELSTDQTGTILFYEDRVFRAISEKFVEQAKDIIENGLLDEIVERKLFPKTWVSDIEIEGYQMVLEHEKIIHWNYPYEWSFDMLRDAGLVVLEVNKIANKYGYEIMDGHSYNVVFNMGIPQYVDFGSFVKLDNEKKKFWKSYSIFYNQFYIPLSLWSKNLSDTARNIFLMSDYFNEFEFYKIKHPIISLFCGNKIFKIVKNIQRLSNASKAKIINKINNPIKRSIGLLIHLIFKNKFNSEKLENQLKNFKKPKEASMWSNYHDTIDPASTKRFIRIKEIIESLEDANSLVEIASNQGKFAEFVLDSTHIEKVIATDYDKEAVNTMYINNKRRDNFLPLLFDMVRTNKRGFDKSIDERIKSDIVLALAVMHHLLLTQQVPIDFIFRKMASFTNKYIIVEFMPLGLYSGDLDKVPSLPEHYNLDWFKSKFTQYFDLILDEQLEINRHMFLGKKTKKV